MGNHFSSLSCQSWANLGATYPIADDRSTNIWSDFGNGAIPRNAIIDSDGVVRYNSIGYNETAVTAILNELLGVTATGDETEAPQAHQLISSYPNPFNAETSILFELPSTGEAILTIHDARGEIVRVLLSSGLAAGSHALTWNARDNEGSELPSGVYIASLKSSAGQSTVKVLLLK